MGNVEVVYGRIPLAVDRSPVVFSGSKVSLLEGRDSGLRVCWRCGMLKITIEITGWSKN